MATKTYQNKDGDREDFDKFIAEAMSLPSLELFPDELEMGEDKEEELKRFDEYE